MCGEVVLPSLSPGEVLDGFLLSRISKQKTVYIRPLEDIRCVDEISNEVSAQSEPEVINADDFDESDDLPDLLRGSPDQLEQDTELAIQNSLHDFNTEHNDIRTLQDILREQQSKINTITSTQFNVNRENVFSSSLRAMRRKTFSPYNRVSVKFTDVNNNSEGAIDNGGPSREMWRLLMKYLQSSNLFEGPETNKNITLNNKSLAENLYFEAGRVIAMSIVHGGPSPGFFSETLFTCITEGIESAHPTVEEIMDYDIQFEIQTVENASSLNELEEAVRSSAFLLIAGCSPIVRTLEQKEDLVKGL